MHRCAATHPPSPSQAPPPLPCLQLERTLLCGLSPYQSALVDQVRRSLRGAAAGSGLGGCSGSSSIEGRSLAPASSSVNTTVINNSFMELRNICNHPFISRLHPEFGEALLPPCPLPPLVTLAGKMELLDRCLLKLHATNHKVRSC